MTGILIFLNTFIPKMFILKSFFLPGWGKRWRLGGTVEVEVDLVQEHVRGLDPVPLADSKLTYNVFIS